MHGALQRAALHVAAENGSALWLQMLLWVCPMWRAYLTPLDIADTTAPQYGADGSLTDASGYTPYALSSRAGHQFCMDILSLHGFTSASSQEPVDEVSETYNTATDSDDDNLMSSSLRVPPNLLSGAASSTEGASQTSFMLPTSLNPAGISAHKQVYMSPLSLASTTIVEEAHDGSDSM